MAEVKKLTPSTAGTTEVAFGTPKTTFLAVDVEKKGARFAHPVIQVGVAYGTSLDDIKTATFCFDYADVPFEKRCWDEFWTNHEDIYEKICAAAQPPKEEWKRFAQFLNDLEPACHDKIEIVSDNPAYDVEAIDYHLNAIRIGIRYSSKDKYRSVHDSTEMVKGLPGHYKKKIQEKTDRLAQHTHWAEDDARAILIHFLLTRAVIDRLREAERAIDDILA